MCHWGPSVPTEQFEQNLTALISFMWSGFGSQGISGVPSCWTEPGPADSKINTPRPMLSPINDAGGAYVITYLANGKNYWAAAVREECEKCEGNSPTDT